MQMRTEVISLVVAIVLAGDGMLLVWTSRNPQRNALTRMSYRLCTMAPRIGSITDKTWVLINGAGLLIAGLFLLVRFVYLALWS